MLEPLFTIPEMPAKCKALPPEASVATHAKALADAPVLRTHMSRMACNAIAKEGRRYALLTKWH